MTARPDAPSSPQTAAGQSLGAMPCSRLFLIRGVPGSGKTTYAKTLGIADHYEADMWFDENGGYDPAKIKLAHAWCQKQAVAAMRAGRDVVVSNTFTRLWEMHPYKDAARILGIEVIEKVMHGEWPNVHGVPADKVRQMRERFEYANSQAAQPRKEGGNGFRVIWRNGGTSRFRWEHVLRGFASRKEAEVEADSIRRMGYHAEVRTQDSLRHGLPESWDKTTPASDYVWRNSWLVEA